MSTFFPVFDSAQSVYIDLIQVTVRTECEVLIKEKFAKTNFLDKSEICMKKCRVNNEFLKHIRNLGKKLSEKV